MSKNERAWLLICSLCMLCAGPLFTLSTPLPAAGNTNAKCPPHDSVAALIRTSPLILKALGARIFTDEDLSRMQSEWWSANAGDETDARVASTQNSWQGSHTASTDHDNLEAEATSTDGITIMALPPATPSQPDSILITLTPETIYKGASLLKTMPGSANAPRTPTAPDSAYQYESQLNATVEPLACFDNSLLTTLPTEIIIFGKLVNAPHQHQQPTMLGADDPISATQQAQAPSQQKQILRISINGLHRWSAQFENHIWKHLGWDDWSDFTLCSVTCGKGVQQRFRRCLLDNPMAMSNFNMNMNLNALADDDVVEDDSAPSAENQIIHLHASSASRTFDSDDSSPIVPEEITTGNVEQQEKERRWLNQNPTFNSNNVLAPNRADNDDVRRVRGAFDRRNSNNPDGDGNSNESSDVANGNAKHGAAGKEHTQGKRRKSTKTMSTLFCEGYNIEQRNCNTFECSDDINDLMKFYKKYASGIEDVQPSSMAPGGDFASATTIDSLTASSAATLSSTATSAPASPASAPATSSSSALNGGYIGSWRNALNFTLMLTLRAKNDKNPTATIFTLRNASHSLYMEPTKDGLGLFLERDNTTEMLPLKFNLYDFRWHQVAISIQNGDFISIYVDCAWTNSFIVSKRLYALPLNANVEIGHGFDGELQQLLVLPENQERYQCSSKRTSINEVKRYIIDTFIDDYAN